jgi:hypothetical protein
VNRTVQTPVASSGILAALAEAQNQFQSGSPILSKPFTITHLKGVAVRVEDVIEQVMVGVITPREGAMQILRLGDHP